MLRERLQLVLNAPAFERTILVLIAVNAVTLGLETSPTAMAAFGNVLFVVDRTILAIFTLEIAARLFVDFRGFWRDPWRIFDFIVVGIALLPAAGSFSVLRAFRILRILRLISKVEAMRRVVSGLLSALSGIGSIVLLLGLIFYVFAVISTKLFAKDFPDWFGSIGESAYTLFQIMTLESWSMGIVRPVMEVHPFAWALFVPFIVATAFTVLNLFIGVIVDAMQSEHEAEARAERDAMMSETELILAEVKALRAEVAELRKGSQTA
ncbi:ion transporter [Denitrobaculum tricleocarpae]|uniref:Ion transporter n=1 Tax=Denitrobaculum tricleocarpae TaxID=2591009 RepID=A0A545TR85_9PROT|nr:ion transporter [Denitrobaculum tricleocarpae]TQV79728.1 ion transporter [Denitrobaculum tricleocarpae]